MNQTQIFMMSSLSNSLYKAINPYTGDPEIQYLDYDTTTSTLDRYFKMEDDCNETSSKLKGDLDVMVTEDPALDELLLTLSGSDYSPLFSWSEQMDQLPCPDLLASASEIGSDGTEDNTSEYSDQSSCGSYEDAIINDYPDTYPPEADFYSCTGINPVTYQPEPCPYVTAPSTKKKPGRKKGQTSKVLHLWEFIRDLLKDPAFCGKIIKWENHNEGVFRVVQSSAVADLWGAKKKNKKAMTYEKMSRSMRYSRKEGYFVDLPKNSGYPKKLCFRFGPKSTGWQ